MPHPPDDANGCPLVLVTGAAGKIGRHVTAALLKAGFGVRGLTTKAVAPTPPQDGIEWRTADFMRSLDVAAHVEGCAAVVHLAAEIVDRSRMERVNVQATEALAQAAASAGVKAFCAVSSASVYGSSRGRRVTEDSPTVNPLVEVKGEYWAPPTVQHYARTKLLAEHRVIAAAQDMKVVIVRPTVVVDVPDILQLAKRSRLRQCLVGRRHAHHVYVADVAAAVVWLLRRALDGASAARPIEIYNIAEDEVDCSTYAKLARRLRPSGRSSAPPVSMPAIIDWAVEYGRYGALPWRYSFGRMSISGDRLKAQGFDFPNGLERLYAMIERGRGSPLPEAECANQSPIIAKEALQAAGKGRS